MSADLHFTVYFDGTGNNKDIHTPEGMQTNVARLYELDTAKGTNLARNSEHAPIQYNALERSGKSEKVYFDGVGSQAERTAVSYLEGGTGLGSQERIEQAYSAIVAFHNKYPDQKIDVNIVGFSRGAAQSRALANELINRGVPKLNEEGIPTDQYLILPGQAHVNKLGIFDTVASYGSALGDTHLGKNLEISENVASTTHLVAMNEYRRTFRLTSALRSDSDNSRIEELKFAGAHSQVGGGYRNDILAAGPLAVMYERLQAAGIQMAPMLQEDVQRIEQYNELIKSPAKVQDALIDSRLQAGNEAFTRSVDGSFQKIDNSPFILEKGTVNFFSRQNRPFDHEVNGRGVIFENDDSLSKSLLVRNFERFGAQLKDLGNKALSAASRYIGHESKKEAYDSTEKSLSMQKSNLIAASHEQVSGLSNNLKVSRPSASYIEGLKLQPVPVPQTLTSLLQPDLQSQPPNKKSMKSGGAVKVEVFDGVLEISQATSSIGNSQHTGWVTMASLPAAGLPNGVYPLSDAIDPAKKVHPQSFGGQILHVDQTHVYQFGPKGILQHDRKIFDQALTGEEPAVGKCYAVSYSRGVGKVKGEITLEESAKLQAKKARSL
ncbi:putative alpha/beta hydrolase family protein DUF2235 [Pseudomonas duriflava]|uniref:Putative alpha/beta hydrolase family protein DUF2235 n=1 Tax=Pseudomonas duriflava TaxID=459528 RepID=A0A562PTM2_9PSED|nr:DUF2235 domain-containing protein [Pseudomonas duriflava]TWI47781.1 putative alpha/beta hydrolase family protein DUF2235 [Pseudomonas duriflava]